MKDTNEEDYWQVSESVLFGQKCNDQSSSSFSMVSQESLKKDSEEQKQPEELKHTLSSSSSNLLSLIYWYQSIGKQSNEPTKLYTIVQTPVEAQEIC